RLFAHRVFGPARLSAVWRDARPLELCRHGSDRGGLALSRAHRKTAPEPLNKTFTPFVPASPHGPENLRLAPRAQPQGLGRADEGVAGDLPGAGARLRAQAAVHSADAAACGRRLLARPPSARRPARPRAGGQKRRARGLDLAGRRGPTRRPPEELPAAAG